MKITHVTTSKGVEEGGFPSNGNRDPMMWTSILREIIFGRDRWATPIMANSHAID
jgi:hypothetical protein